MPQNRPIITIWSNNTHVMCTVLWNIFHQSLLYDYNSRDSAHFYFLRCTYCTDKTKMANKWIVKEIKNNHKFDELCKKNVLLLNFFNGSSLMISTLWRTWLDGNRLIVLHRTTCLRYLGFFKAFVLRGLTQSSQSTFFLVKKISIQDLTIATTGTNKSFINLINEIKKTHHTKTVVQINKCKFFNDFVQF